MSQHPSNSMVQCRIEREMISYLEKHHPDWRQIDWYDLCAGKELALRVKPDAVWRDGEGVIIIAECYARIGKLKSGHRCKIATDILKLFILRDEFDKKEPLRLILVVPDDLGSQLEDNDWISMVIRKESMLVKVPLSDEQHLKLINAVKLQGEGQSHSVKPYLNPNVQEILK